MKLKTQLAALLILVAGATAIVSCKKDVKEAKQKTKMELLTTGSWTRTGFVSDPAYDWYGDGTYATNLLSIMYPCELDNFETYYTDGTWELNEGTTKCEGSDPQARTLPWAFAESETKLVFNGWDEYILVELTPTTLKLGQAFLQNGVLYQQTQTYSH
ncbi:MAG TPA: hypothetical protein VGQ53_21385 [Chitinophagaceae bacterium]|jgi:hypothetical protein|nr:hypothetical protein [Chitinophagaceae bacterium]